MEDWLEQAIGNLIFNRDTTMQRVLVLNATYEPLSIISVQRAIILLLKEKAEMVEAATEYLHAACTSVPVPLVIRLVYYVRIPHPVTLAPTRRSVAARPLHLPVLRSGPRPQPADHRSHHPRSRGVRPPGKTSSRPAACNMRKGDRTPEEAGMELRKRPGGRITLPDAFEAGPRDVWGKYIYG